MKISIDSNKTLLALLAIVLLSVAILVHTDPAIAARLSLSGLKSEIDKLDQRLTDCEEGVGGVCQGASPLNVVKVALDGGDFTSIQAAIDSVPERNVPGLSVFPPPQEVTPTLIKIAPGEYFEQISLRDNIHLQGAGRNQTILQAPLNLDADCGGRSPIICVEDVTDVEITDVGISGLNKSFLDQAETAINIVDATNIRITGMHITNVVEGIIGEAVGNILLRDNDIPFPADAIVLSMGGTPADGDLPLPLASIIGNRVDSGRITVFSQGSVHLVGNLIAGDLGNEWQGKLHASGNQIIGDVFFGALGDSLFNDNTLLGSLHLIGDSETSVIGNSISGSGFLIVDNGGATIVGNTLLSDNVPISASPSTSSTIFANRFEGSDGATLHNSLVSNNEITLESRNEKVTIKAGNSSIVVDSAGAITIDSAADISLTSGGKFSVEANEIDLKSDTNFTAEGALGAELKSGFNTVVKGAIVRIN